MKLKPNTIDWLFNQTDARKAVPVIGARNITVVKSVVLNSSEDEEEISSYDKMVMYSSQEADQNLIEWMKDQIVKHNNNDPERRYLYFRFKRFN